MKKLSKLDEKIRKKTKRVLINKKLLKLDEKIKKKPIIYCFVRDEKPLKPKKKNEKENRILIKDKDEKCLKTLN